MDFHGKFSMGFHGGLGHQLPWNSMEISPQISMENIRTPIFMDCHGNFYIDIFHGGLGYFPWNSMEKLHAIP